MRGISWSGLVVAILCSVMLMAGPASATAVDRRQGNSWSYEMSTVVEVGSFEMSVNGTLAYRLVDHRALTTESGALDVNVMELDGELTGSLWLFGELFVNTSVVMEGFLYETRAGGGIVKEDTHSLTSSISGSGEFAISEQIEEEIVTTYSPPLLQRMGGTWTIGDSWSETTSVRSASTVWKNGTLQSYSDDTRTQTYSVAVHYLRDSVETLAGTFLAERINVTDPSGDYQLRWWSGGADNYVKLQYFRANSTKPHTTLVLDEYHYGKADPGDVLLLFVGLTSLAVGCIVLAAVVTILGQRPRPPPPNPNIRVETR